MELLGPKLFREGDVCNDIVPAAVLSFFACAMRFLMVVGSAV